MNEKCFALRRGCTCNALMLKNCVGYQRCPFYRPVWKQQQLQKKVFVRLRRLPEAVQTEISSKYYRGETPWKDVVI